MKPTDRESHNNLGKDDFGTWISLGCCGYIHSSYNILVTRNKARQIGRSKRSNACDCLSTIL